MSDDTTYFFNTTTRKESYAEKPQALYQLSVEQIQ